MEYTGRSSDAERIYHVNVVQDSSTATEGVHYQVIDKKQIFRPNVLHDTLRIVVCRDNMNSRFKEQERYRLELELEPSEDFDLGIRQGIRKTLWLNNYMSEPVWWEGNFHGTLGFFHPEKWKILISWDQALPIRTVVPTIGTAVKTLPKHSGAISTTMRMPFTTRTDTGFTLTASTPPEDDE